MSHCSDRTLNKAVEVVTELIEAATWGRSPSHEIQNWIDGLSDEAHERFASCGMVHARKKRQIIQLNGFVTHWIEKRKPKQSTRHVWNRARQWLVKHFGEDRSLADITEDDAEDWQRHLSENLAEATTRKMCSVARQMFKSAVKAGLIARNPFLADGIRTAIKGNPERFHFITEDDTQKLLDACPGSEWKAIIGLCRYGGLRNPSEVLSLQWEHVNWAEDRILIRSPKTGDRICPLFPELRRSSPTGRKPPGLVPYTSWNATATRQPTCGRSLRRSSSGPV